MTLSSRRPPQPPRPPHASRPRRSGPAARLRPSARGWVALFGSLLMVLGMTSAASYGTTEGGAAADEPRQDQVLTWTAGNPIDRYLEFPETAVAGEATIVFENSEASGNTTNMPHTLTFVTTDPEYNDDVDLDILASPSDPQGGLHEQQVTLSPGQYKYVCTIPGHGQMQGVLTVTEGGGGEDDTTPPEVAAEVTGDQNGDGDYISRATVTVTATDAGSGVHSVEFAEGAEGEWQPYTNPVIVDQLGEHTVRYRATDHAGNVSEEQSESFTVVPPPSDDDTAPETSATVSGDQDEDGNYLGMATVTVTASDAESGVDGIEYALGAEGDWQEYTAPVMVHEVGEHTLRYRATDRAGNTSEEAEVSFTVVEPPSDDVTPPEVSAEVRGARNAAGAYITSASVEVTATDDDSGVALVEYSLDGGPYLEYTEPVIVDRYGYHTVAYRATDEAGNTSQARQASFTVVTGGGVPAPNCPEYDERLTVFVGEVNTGVPNRMTGSRCTINELIEDEKDWSSHALFLKHVDELLDRLVRSGEIDARERETIASAARESGIGTPGNTTGYRTLFDGTEQSFNRWHHVGGGEFGLSEDGAMTSSTSVAGMGMLWYPERRYENFSLKLQWRDDAPEGMYANAGVFARFPHPNMHPEESRPEWVAIKYGHELQILDRPDGDMYKSGSVYGFDRVSLSEAGVTPKGTWNDYEIRVIDQRYEVYRNGVLINEFDNSRGQFFNPPRGDDPGTDGRQLAAGYIGLQVHGTTDVISYRDIRIKELRN